VSGIKSFTYFCFYLAVLGIEFRGSHPLGEHILPLSHIPSPKIKVISSQAPMAHAYNPGYLGGRDQEDLSSKPSKANSSWDPILKISKQKRTGGVAQVVACPPSKYEALSSSPSTSKKKKNSFSAQLTAYLVFLSWTIIGNNHEKSCLIKCLFLGKWWMEEMNMREYGWWASYTYIKQKNDISIQNWYNESLCTMNIS
jgi:hypothetical protein